MPAHLVVEGSRPNSSTPVRATLTREEAAEFLTEHQRLISRYQRGPDNCPPGARTVIIRFLTYPEPPPEQRDVPEEPREAPEHDS